MSQFELNFLLYIDKTGLIQDEIESEALRLVTQHFFVKIAAVDKVLENLIATEYRLIRFTDRASIHIGEDQRSSHQRMAEQKNAAANFLEFIGRSWLENALTGSHGASWFCNVPIIRQTALYLLLEKLGNDHALCTELVMNFLREDIAAVDKAILEASGKPDDVMSQLTVKHGEKTARELRRVQTALPKAFATIKHGAFVDPIFPDIRLGDWVSFDLTGGAAPNAALTMVVSLDDPMYQD